jgi:hypothetical protein
MNNPHDTFKNIKEMLKHGIGKDLRSKENKLSIFTTNLINFTISASLIIGIIYLIKSLF